MHRRLALSLFAVAALAAGACTVSMHLPGGMSLGTASSAGGTSSTHATNRSSTASHASHASSTAASAAAAPADNGQSRQALWKRYRDARRAIDNAFGAFPRSYGRDPPAEAKRIERAAAYLERAKGEVSPGMNQFTDYPKVTHDLEQLEFMLKQGRLFQACSAARFAVISAHHAGHQATPAQLAALTDTVNKLDAFEPATGKKSVAFWKKEQARLTQEDPTVKPLRVQIPGALKTPAQKRAYEKAMQAATGKVNPIAQQIDGVVRGGDTPIPQATLDSFKAATEALRKVDPKAAHYYDHLMTTYEIENAWRKGGKAGAKEIAKILGGTVAESGSGHGKTFKLSIRAKKDVCYTLFTRWRTSTGREKLGSLKWRAAGASDPMQRYYVSSRFGPRERTYGVCTTRRVKVDVRSKLTFAGTRNGVDYVVVATAKAHFPMYVATNMRVSWADSCDTKAWEKMWTDPIPGSVVYINKEPYILLDPDRAGQMWNTLANLTMNTSQRAEKHQLVDAPPAKVVFSTQFSFPGCPGLEYAHYQDSVRLGKCEQKITRRYQKRWDRAQQMKREARTLGALHAAEGRLSHLQDLDARDRHRECDPIKRRISKKWQRMFNQLVDRLTDHPPKSPIDRAAELFDEDQVYRVP